MEQAFASPKFQIPPYLKTFSMSELAAGLESTCVPVWRGFDWPEHGLLGRKGKKSPHLQFPSLNTIGVQVWVWVRVKLPVLRIRARVEQVSKPATAVLQHCFIFLFWSAFSVCAAAPWFLTRQCHGKVVGEATYRHTEECRKLSGWTSSLPHCAHSR